MPAGGLRRHSALALLLIVGTSGVLVLVLRRVKVFKLLAVELGVRLEVLKHVLNLLDLLAIVLGCELRRHLLCATHAVLLLEKRKQVLVGVLCVRRNLFDLVLVSLRLVARDRACSQQVTETIACQVATGVGLDIAGPLTLLPLDSWAAFAVLGRLRRSNSENLARASLVIPV